MVQTSLDLISFGAEGITVHPRPDERHIKRMDVYALRDAVQTVEFNIEGYPNQEFLELIKDVKPEQVTFVPDPPEVLTSNAGWRLKGNESILEKCLALVGEIDSRSSLFVDPSEITIEELKSFYAMGARRIELYTEKFSDDFGTPQQDKTVELYKKCADQAKEIGFGLNAGHDLNLKNLKALKQAIPNLDEVSIGHALVCDALYLGYKETVTRYLSLLEG